MINALNSEDYQPEQKPALIRMFILPWAVFVCGSRGGGGGGCALLHLSNKSAVTCMEELVSAIVFKGSVCAVFRILWFFNLLQFAKANDFPAWEALMFIVEIRIVSLNYNFGIAHVLLDP